MTGENEKALVLAWHLDTFWFYLCGQAHSFTRACNFIARSPSPENVPTPKGGPLPPSLPPLLPSLPKPKQTWSS